MRSDAEHLQGILDAIDRLGRYVGTGGRAAFDASDMARDAITFRLAVIGEAAARLTPAMRDRAPEIPWRKIIAMRNILVHDYLAIDPDVVWVVATAKLDELRVTVETLLAEERL